MRGNYYSKASRKAILRRLQKKLAEKGNAPMAIWLEKPRPNQPVVMPIEPKRSRWKAVEYLMGDDR